MKQLSMLHFMCAAHLLVEIFVEAVKKERHQLLGVLLRESAELRRELAHDLLEARRRDDLGAQEKDGKVLCELALITGKKTYLCTSPTTLA
jgi:hypothetical protein